MKKLQLLALTMLLSTPFAITYTSESADRKVDRQDDRQGNRDSKQDARQARRQERLDGWKDIKSSLQAFSQDDDAVEAKKSSLQDRLTAQLATLQDEIASLPKGSTARSNSSDEQKTLKNILETRRTDLQNRMAHLQSCISEHKAQIAAEKTTLAAKQAQIASGKEKAEGANIETPMSSNRIANLQEQATDLQNCIADKTAMVVALQAKVDTAQTSLLALEAKIGAENMATKASKSMKKMIS
jgi:chromosome segregation ATPase